MTKQLITSLPIPINMQYKNVLAIALIISIAVISSCQNREKELDQVIQTKFNQAIIDDLPAYKRLNDLIVDNIDTIVNFRKAQIEHPERAERFDFLHDNEAENNFIQNDINFNNMPAFILPKMDSAFSSIKKGKISGFSIHANGMIDMSVEHTFNEKTNCDTYSSLVWHMPENLPIDLTAKDTVLTSECRYIVHVMKRGNP